MILVSYNTAEMSVKSLQCLYASKGDFELEVFVVDNASKDNSVALIKQHFPMITMIENKTNVGFGRANNQVLSVIKGDYLLLLNTDAFVTSDTLQKTLSHMQTHPRTGVLGVMLLGRDGVLQPACRYFPTPFNLFCQRFSINKWLPNLQLVDDVNWNPAITKTCDWVPGCYYLVRKQVISEVGLFDPLYFLYYEEVDHCFAVKKAGWDVEYFAGASVVHIGGESAKSDQAISAKSRQVESLQIESELLYFRKNHGISGLASAILLMLVGDTLQMLKGVLALQPWASVKSNISHMGLIASICFATKFATQSTR